MIGIKQTRKSTSGADGMSSWMLFRQLTNFWNAIENPVFMREIQHEPLWQRYLSRALQSSGLTLTLGGLLCYLSLLVAFYADTLLILFVPLVLGWLLLLSLTLAPVVVREREQRTWHTLRTTPLDIEVIVLGKAAGALWWLRHLARGVMALTLIGAIMIGVGSLIFVSFESESLSDLPAPLVCGMTLLLPILSGSLFIADRAQYMMLVALSSLAVSARSSTVRMAAPAAVITALLITAVDTGIGLLIVTQHLPVSRSLIETEMLLLLFGPIVVYLAELPFGVALVIALLTLLVREGVIWVAWRWTLRAALRP